jgi:hypothetical protein
MPRHVSAYGCHLQRIVSALQATQAMSVYRRIRITIRAAWPVVDSTTTGHTGRIVIRIRRYTDIA